MVVFGSECGWIRWYTTKTNSVVVKTNPREVEREIERERERERSTVIA